MIGGKYKWETTSDFELDPKPYAVLITIFPDEFRANYDVYEGDDPCLQAERMYMSVKDDGVTNWFANRAALKVRATRHVKSYSDK